MPYLKAATDHPFGAIPYGRVLSVGAYNKDASGGAIYPGDFVIQETDGAIAIATTGSTQIIGVAAEYSAATTAKTDFLVYDASDQEFAIQDDSDTTGLTEASIALNANITVTTGDTTLLRSKHEIDSNTSTTSNVLALKVMGLHPIEARNFATTTAQQRTWIVKINTHFWSPWQQTGI